MARPRKNIVKPLPVEVKEVIPNAEEIKEQSFKTVEETKPEEIKKPLNNKIRELIDELDGRDISVIYPSSESKWDNALYERLSKLKK